MECVSVTINNDPQKNEDIDLKENLELDYAECESIKSNNNASSSPGMSSCPDSLTDATKEEQSKYGMLRLEISNQENTELSGEGKEGEEPESEISSSMTVTQPETLQERLINLERQKRKHPQKIQSFDSDCSKDCWRNCKENISDGQRQNLFNQFWDLKSKEERQDYITRNVTRIRLSNPDKDFWTWRLYSVDWAFTIDNVAVSVCKVFFLHTLGVTQKFAYSAIKAKDNYLKPKKGEMVEVEAQENSKVSPIISNGNSSLKPGCIVCRRNCQSKFTMIERKSIFDEYHSLSASSQQVYLSTLVKKIEIKRMTRLTKSRRGCTLEWTLPKNGHFIQVCKTFFIDTVGVNEKAVNNVKLKERIEPLEDLYCFSRENKRSIPYQSDLLLKNFQPTVNLRPIYEQELSFERPIESNRRLFQYNRSGGKNKRNFEKKSKHRKCFEETAESKVQTDDKDKDCELISEVICDASDDDYEYVYTCKRRRKKYGPNKYKNEQIESHCAEESDRPHYDNDEELSTASLDTSDHDITNGYAGNFDSHCDEEECSRESSLHEFKPKQDEHQNTSSNCEKGYNTTTRKKRNNSTTKPKYKNANSLNENMQRYGQKKSKAYKSELTHVKNKGNIIATETLEGQGKLVKRKRNIYQKLKKRHLPNPKLKPGHEDDLNKKKRNLTKTKKAPNDLYPPCDDSCKLRCKYNVSQEVRQSIFKEFWSLHTMSEQRKYITKFVKRWRKPMCACVIANYPNKKRGYSVMWSFGVEGAQIEVCKTYFLHALQVNSSIVYKALLDADRAESKMDLTVQPCKHFTKLGSTRNNDDQASTNQDKNVPLESDCEVTQLSQNNGESQVTGSLQKHLSETNSYLDPQTGILHILGNTNCQAEMMVNVTQISQNQLDSCHVSTPTASLSFSQATNLSMQHRPNKSLGTKAQHVDNTCEAWKVPSSHFPITKQCLRQHLPNTAFEQILDSSCHTQNDQKHCINSDGLTIGRGLNSSSFQHTPQTKVHSQRTERFSARADMLHNIVHTSNRNTSRCVTWEALETNRGCNNESTFFTLCPEISTNSVQDNGNWGMSVNKEFSVPSGESGSLHENQNLLPQENPNLSCMQHIDVLSHSDQSGTFGYTAELLHRNIDSLNNWVSESNHSNVSHTEQSVDQRYQEHVLLLKADALKNTANEGVCSKKLTKSEQQRNERKAFCQQNHFISKRVLAQKAREEEIFNKHVKKGCGNTTCRRKCSEKIPHIAREKLLKELWSLKSIAQRRHYLMPMVSKVPKKSCSGADSRRSCTVEWKLPYEGEMHIVCKRFFIDTFDIGEKSLQGVLDRKQENSSMEDMRGKGPAAITAQQVAQVFIKSHCVQRIFICQVCLTGFTSWCFDANDGAEDPKTRTQMHKVYEKQCMSEGATPISRATFLKLCTEKFKMFGTKLCKSCSNGKKSM